MSLQQPKQRTKEWLEARKGRITGSRVGAILGLSPFQKSDDVMRAMVREHHGYPGEFVGNIATAHGNNNEQRALLAFMRETGLQVEECGFFEYNDKMGATPDGLTSDGGVLELKVPFSLRNGGTFKTLAEQPHYAAQAQLEMLATGRKHCYFVQYIAPKGDTLDFDYIAEKINIERVEFDHLWLDNNLTKISDFYRLYLLELDNPKHLEPLRVEINTPETGLIIARILYLKDLQKSAAEEEKELLRQLVLMTSEKDAEMHGHKLTKVKRAGSVNWAKVAKELMPKDFDLESYRGKTTEFWRIS